MHDLFFWTSIPGSVILSKLRGYKNMKKTISDIKEKISAETDNMFRRSDDIYRLIKELKKSIMKQNLGIPEDDDIFQIYKSSFKSCGWDIVKLKDVVNPGGIIEGPRDRSVYDAFYSGSGVPVICPGDIKSLRFFPDNEKYISFDAASRFKEYSVHGAEIIIRIDDADKGASAIVPIMNEDCILGPGVIKISPDNSIAEVFYILNLLHFYYNTGIVGSIIGGPSTESVSEIIIPLPPLDKQKQVSELMLELSAGMVAQESYRKEMDKFLVLMKGYKE